jgi:hypothetical protein
MTEYFTIGATPCNEECAQLGAPDYSERVRVEGRAFIDLIRRVLGPEPRGARLHVKGFPHDFGTYHEVVCTYDPAVDGAETYALRCENDAPAEWDDIAREQLAAGGLPRLTIGAVLDHKSCR